MYDDNNRKSYFFRDLIVKILLVLLFVFLLMWLFPMPNLNPLYDKVFTQNISNMTDAARSYFTVSRLPQKEGETKKLTLADMLNNKMIIKFTDSEGKSCDAEKSYVEVTKKDNEYVFKTNLVCSNQEDYVIEYFGCYDVCEDGKCNVEVIEKPNSETKKVTEYQFYKNTESKYIEKYVCEKGYTLEGTKCILATEIKKEEAASMKCLTGYSYNENTKKCEKVNTSKVDASLSCPTGYIYASSMDKCIKGTEDVVDAVVSYKCEKGILVGTKCIISNLEVKAAEKEYSCKEGILSGTKCIINTTKEVDAEKEYSCKEGKLDGTKCIVDTTKEVDATLTYKCSKGTVSGSSCIIKNPDVCSYTNWVCSNKTYTTAMSTTSTPTFTRRYLYMVGLNRVYEECSRTYKCTSGGTSTVAAEKVYSCKEGTLSGTKCIVNTTKELDATLTYKCTTGKLNGTKCVVNTAKELDATLTYKCSVGTLNGINMCEIITTSEENAKKVYSCEAGTLNGTKCEISGIDTADYIYTCKYGTLSGKSCLIATTEAKEPIYYCRSGYTLADKKCYMVENSNDIKDATPIYKTKTETIYKWSTSEKLTGWTRTGKTRTTNVAITSKY